MINGINQQVQSFACFLIILIAFTIEIHAKNPSTLGRASYKLQQSSALEPEDEQLLADIMQESMKLYQGMIDLFALYFSGLIIDNDQFLERLFLEVCGEFLQVFKLLARYGPRMLQNPHISAAAKIKKIGYITSFVIICWGLINYERSCVAVRRHAMGFD